MQIQDSYFVYCESCVEGKSSEGGANQCRDCDIGTYSDSPALSTCKFCPQGKHGTVKGGSTEVLVEIAPSVVFLKHTDQSFVLCALPVVTAMKVAWKCTVCVNVASIIHIPIKHYVKIVLQVDTRNLMGQLFASRALKASILVAKQGCHLMIVSAALLANTATRKVLQSACSAGPISRRIWCHLLLILQKQGNAMTNNADFTSCEVDPELASKELVVVMFEKGVALSLSFSISAAFVLVCGFYAD